MKKNLYIFYIFITLITFISCSHKVDKFFFREKLIKLGYGFTKQDFLKALNNDNDNIVGLFIKSGMNPNLSVKVKTFMVPSLFYAIDKQKFKSAKALIENGANVNASVLGLSILMKASQVGTVDTVISLLNKGADIKKSGFQGMTALMFAIENDKPGIAWILMSRGSDINAKDDFGITILMRASSKGMFDLGEIKDEDNTTIKQPLKEAKEPINVILVSDSDILNDELWVKRGSFFGQKIIMPTADNGRFVINALENLGGNDAFIALRGRGKSKREFTYLQELKKEAEIKYLKVEKGLQSKLSNLQQKLNQQREGIKDIAMLSAKQKQLMQEAQNEIVNVRKELREVQHNLNKDIKSTQNLFKWFNILFMPIIVSLFGLWFINGRKNLLQIFKKGGINE
jgi:hypothetical protein